MGRPVPKTWRFALLIGSPIGLGLGLTAGVTGGPVAGLALGAGSFLFSVAVVAVVSLVYVLVMTRGGARGPEGVLTDEHAITIDLGGTPADAWLRAREAALTLPGAKVLSEDPGEGLLELEARLGPYVQRIRLRLDGTTVSAIARHEPVGKLFDFGAAGRQLADLRALLERTRRASTDEIEREAVRRAARERTSER